MLMAVYERVREIGMMRALGMRDRFIRLAFLLEAGGIGLVGSAVGLVLGAALNWYMVRWGLDLSASRAICRSATACTARSARPGIPRP